MASQRDFTHTKTWINVLLRLLQLFLPYIQHGGAQFQALTQMSGVVEVWQAEDADFFMPSQAEEQHSENVPREESSSFYVQESRRQLQFQPPTLDFGPQPLGLPRAETVYIRNPSPELPVSLLSVFTSSRHFHMPSFHRRVIPPRGRTSFKIIFLPTVEGNEEITLFINTSTHGLISYQNQNCMEMQCPRYQSKVWKHLLILYQVFGVGVYGGSVKDVHRKDSVLLFPHVQSINLTQTQEDASNITILGLLLDCSLPKMFSNQPQGWCLVSEEGRFALRISLSERGDRHLDKLKPYVLENIVVLLVLPPPEDAADPRIGVFVLNSGVKQLCVKEIQLMSRTDSSVELTEALLKPSAMNFTQVASLFCRRSLSAKSTRCPSQFGLEILANRTVNLYPLLESTHRWPNSELSSLVQVRQKPRGSEQVELWLFNPFLVTFRITHISLSQHRVFKIVNLTKSLEVRPGSWKLLSLQLLSRSLPTILRTTVTLRTSVGTPVELHLQTYSSASKQGDVMFESAEECERLCPLRLSRAGRVEWQQSLLPESSSSLWKVDSSLASALCSRWLCSKGLSCRWPRLPANHSSPLDFGATPVNDSKVKNFTLKNPTGSVVSVEIRTLSSYPVPLEALDMLTKWFNISPLSVNITTAEFLLLAANHKDSERGRVLRFVLRPWESRTVSVAYQPTEHKHITSLLLIRNNLTVFDMVLVKGFGAKELLRVGGKLPGPAASLRFNVPQSTLMECRDGLRSSKPLFSIQKSFKVENAGELPLTVVSMSINGYKCQGYGFEVQHCRSFKVDYNSSSEITIAFTPDFTSSWVIRDLTLVTERGSVFHFTLNVTLPHHMLPLCAQVVPGPSWEEPFWIITLVFTCSSLAGVCLMAFHQAQHILSEFSTPSPRSNHNSVPRENSSVTHSISNGVRGKGSCKNYTDTSHPSDKGKGRGSPAVANGTIRPQSSSKKSSGASSQPPKKQMKVSFLYSRYKTSPASAAAGDSAASHCCSPPTDGDRERSFELDPEVCNNNNNILDESLLPAEKKQHFRESRGDEAVPADMFPMETLPESIITSRVPQPADEAVQNQECKRKKHAETRDNVDEEKTDRGSSLKKRPEKDAELGVSASKAKRNLGRSRRNTAELIPGLPENSVVMVTESERESQRNAARTRNTKPEPAKAGASPDSPVKHSGTCLSRPRRKCPERRLQWESGSDSSSSSGSVRASRGSWGSWSSASSVEGEKDPNRHPCRRDNQYHPYPKDRECYMNYSYKTQSMNNLSVRQPCQNPDVCPAPALDVAAGVDKSIDTVGSNVIEETWSPASVPLTNEFRYNMTESLPFVPQSPSLGYDSFPWNNMNSQRASPYPYRDQTNCMPTGNGNYQTAFSCHESQTVTHSHQPVWGENATQNINSTWDTSKPYFSGTRSLSPMSSLFGSIWTPQSEPHQSHFHSERSVAPFRREPGGACPRKPYSSFNPFGVHMNLDIWNSSSNRSSTSQLSSDSGYCGEM
ncbi:transmembrane protein 131-like isoform X2 [Sinocyclocheilus rhinocerous]|uniref:transmembrane protein 131-like isoform X2 n=1 Tax=Sinocyclocheilus rhinocerous TaxID=307959 RepID=UPI0007BA9BED|nr:PREDICTED: transmembrane protein 131-like isoform X2 [Sinocyclocheilus rhinocerous]